MDKVTEKKALKRAARAERKLRRFLARSMEESARKATGGGKVCFPSAWRGWSSKRTSLGRVVSS